MRHLIRSPGFVLVTIALLAIGIGANTAIFSLLAAVLTGTPPGIAAPEQLVVFTRTGERLGFAGFSYPDYCDYRDRAHSFAGLMAYHTTKFSIRVGDEPAQMTGAEITPNYFPVLGTGSEIHDAVILSEKWRGAPGLSGPKTVRVNGRPYPVAALAPVGFRGTEIDEPLDVWVPLETSPGAHRPDAFSDPGERADAFLTIVGRVKPGVLV
jgi:putative ABC transport system permease protein